MTWDLWLFESLNQTWTHPWLDRVMPTITSSATYRLPVALVAGLVLLRGPARWRWVLLGLIACVALSDLISSRGFKPLIDRPRPGWTLPEARLLIGPKGSAAFPSSHAVNLMAATWYLHRTVARWWLTAGMLFAAVVVSYSRIYVGMHYPLDVLAGALLGGLVAEAALRLPLLRRLRAGAELRPRAAGPDRVERLPEDV